MIVKQKLIDCVREEVKNVTGQEDDELIKRTVFLIVFGFEPRYVDRLNKGEQIDIYYEIEDEFENIKDVECDDGLVIYYYNGTIQEVTLKKVENLLVIKGSVEFPDEDYEEEYSYYIKLRGYEIGMF